MVNRLRRSVLSKIVAALAATIIPVVSTSTVKAAAGKNAVHTIEILQFKFTPTGLKIRPGDTIIWRNQDIVPHTATAQDNSWDTGEILPNESKSMTYRRGSDLSYYCRFHPAMTAELQIIVDD